MSLKKTILLKTLERQRAKRSEIQDKINRFDRVYPRWQIPNEADRTKRLQELQSKLAHQDKVLAELRRYIEPGA